MDTQAYTDGGKVGLEFARHSTLEGFTGEAISGWIDVVKAFRSQVTDEQWIRWEGDRFDFPVDGLACPLSLVSFHGDLPLAAEARPHVVDICKNFYVAFFAPLPPRTISDEDVKQLKNPSFFKGMVDAICKYAPPMAKAE